MFCKQHIHEEDEDDELDSKIDEEKVNDENSNNEKAQDVSERRCSSSDPVNLSLGYRERDDDSNDGHIDVETIGNAPSKVSFIIFSQKISASSTVSISLLIEFLYIVRSICRV